MKKIKYAALEIAKKLAANNPFVQQYVREQAERADAQKYVAEYKKMDQAIKRSK